MPKKSSRKRLIKRQEIPHAEKYNWKELNTEAVDITADSPIYVGTEEVPGAAEYMGLRVSFICKNSDPLESTSMNYPKLINIATTLGEQKIGSGWLIADHGPYPYDLEKDEPVQEAIPIEEFVKMQDKVWWRLDIEIGKNPFV